MVAESQASFGTMNSACQYHLGVEALEHCALSWNKHKQGCVIHIQAALTSHQSGDEDLLAHFQSGRGGQSRGPWSFAHFRLATLSAADSLHRLFRLSCAPALQQVHGPDCPGALSMPQHLGDSAVRWHATANRASLMRSLGAMSSHWRSPTIRASRMDSLEWPFSQ